MGHSEKRKKVRKGQVISSVSIMEPSEKPSETPEEKEHFHVHGVIFHWAKVHPLQVPLETAPTSLPSISGTCLRAVCVDVAYSSVYSHLSGGWSMPFKYLQISQFFPLWGKCAPWNAWVICSYVYIKSGPIVFTEYSQSIHFYRVCHSPFDFCSFPKEYGVFTTCYLPGLVSMLSFFFSRLTGSLTSHFLDCLLLCVLFIQMAINTVWTQQKREVDYLPIWVYLVSKVTHGKKMIWSSLENRISPCSLYAHIIHSHLHNPSDHFLNIVTRMFRLLKLSYLF